MNKYTKEERKEIKESFEIMINEIKEMFDFTNINSITVHCPYIEIGQYSYRNNFFLKISKKRIMLCNTFPYLSEWDSVNLDNLMKAYFYPDNYDCAARIIKIYPELKERIISEIGIYSCDKEELLKYVRKIKEDHCSDVEFELPESINRHEMVITHEDDSTIGTINFGSQTVRIITKGNIILVDGDNKDHPQKKIGKNPNK